MSMVSSQTDSATHANTNEGAMTYYLQLTKDIAGNFGAVSKQAIITSLKNGGVSKPADFDGLGLQTKGNKALFDGRLAFLFGTDEKSRLEIGKDLMAYLGNDIDEFALLVPRLKEWLACVTLIDTDGKTKPTFQVVALVGAGILKQAGVNWAVEHKPPQLWKTHAEEPADTKMIRDIKSFTGLGWWK
jgi:hypothetical protein